MVTKTPTANQKNIALRKHGVPWEDITYSQRTYIRKNPTSIPQAEMYPGMSLEPSLNKIKKLHLKGWTSVEILEANPNYGSEGNVKKAIESMKNGKAPVSISKAEMATRPTLAKTLNETFDTLKKKLNRAPYGEEILRETGISKRALYANLTSDRVLSEGRTISGGKKGLEASQTYFKERKVDKPTRVSRGAGGAQKDVSIKFKDAKQEKKYLDFLEERFKYPKASTSNPITNEFLRKKFGISEDTVVATNSWLAKKNKLKYPVAPTNLSGKIRRGQLKKNSNPPLEAYYGRLKKGIRADFSHRESKRLFDVTTSNTGLDDPLINRIIIRPNERKRNSLYAKINNIRDKYLKKDGTYSTPSQEDKIKLAEYNKEIKKLVKQTNGRLSGKIVNQFNLNQPLKDIGVKSSLTIGGSKLKNIPLRDVPNLDIKDQEYLDKRVIKLSEKEVGRKPKQLFQEFENLFKDSNMIERFQNIVNNGRMEKFYKDRMQKVINIAKKAGPKAAAASLVALGIGSVGALFGGGSAEASEIVQPQVIEKPETVQYNPEIGSFVNPITEDKTNQNALLGWATENPLTTLAGTSVAASTQEIPRSYKMRRGVGDMGPLPGGKGKIRSSIGLGGALKPVLTTLGTPLMTLGFEGLLGKQRLEEGENMSDILMDPLGPALGLSFMEPLSKMSGITRNAQPRGIMGGIKQALNLRDFSNVGTARPGIISKALRLGLSPRVIAGVSRGGLYGLLAATALSAGKFGLDQYDKYQNEEGMMYNYFND